MLQKKYPPKRTLLERKLDKNIEKILNQMGKTLDEIVNFGTHVLDMCQEKEDFNEYQSPIVSTFIHFLSLLDGASIIVKKGNGDALDSLLRGIFETGLNLEYMLSEEPKKGTVAYLVSEARDRIKNWRRIDPSTEQGKAFWTLLNAHGIPTPNLNITDRIENLENMLNRSPYNEVNEEWNRYKRENRNDPSWYSLFGGPRKIKGLASNVGKEAFYEVLYKKLSQVVHGTGSSRRVRKTEDGKAVMAGIRTFDELSTTVTMSAVFALDLFRLMIDTFNKDRLKDYAEWYIHNISNDFLSISKAKIKTTYIHDE